VKRCREEESMMSIEKNVREVERRIARACERAGRSPDEVKLVAVTKTTGVPSILAAFNAGIRHFGENRVQEAKSKIAGLESLKPDATWHMIGHLQSNKAKTACDIFDIIHSVDSLKLARTLSGCCQGQLPVLVEVNIASEETKSGFTLAEVEQAVQQIKGLPNLRLDGLMTIAPWVADAEQVRPVFRSLRELGEQLGLSQLSMGMTDDFEVAIEEGATMVRIGRAIFGERA
jgi:pyridoxal phosphate enzyme (YggS family)